MSYEDIPWPARKHISLSLQVKDLAERIRPHWLAFVATYTAGVAGQPYQRMEERSGREFCRIKAYKDHPAAGNRVKDPDVLIVQGNSIKFMIEVKWGTVPDSSGTDLLLSQKELGEMAQLMASPAVCRVRGIAVQNGQRFRSEQFRYATDFATDHQTRLVLVSDFQGVQKRMPAELRQCLGLCKSLKGALWIADIDRRVGEIPSLGEILAASQVEK